MSLISAIWKWGTAILCTAAIVGCADGRPTIVPVSGRVLIDGKPLSRGFVRFVPAGSRASTGKLNSAGEFTLTCVSAGDGAVVGKQSVEIIASEVLSATSIKWYTPKKYSQAATSGLTFEVKEGVNAEALFELSWDGGKPFVETHGSQKPSAEASTGPFGSRQDGA